MSDLYVKRYPELDPELRKYIRENRKKWDAQKQLHIRNTEKEIMGEVEKGIEKTLRKW